MDSEPRGVRGWLAPVVSLSGNPISAAGVFLVTAAAIFWIFLAAGSFGAGHGGDNPYLGILLFIVAPAVFFLGLALIPLGIWLQWRKERRTREILPTEIPPLNFRNVRVRRFAIFLVVTTFVNVIIASHFSYTAVSYMDGVTFCGLTCHTVMSPEYSAYQGSPHSRVECTKCHIGPGASWFVKSKLSGAHQVLAVTFNTFERPIPSPVENLRPARDTCEACHWPQKFGGERLRVIPKFAEDEANTRTVNVLMMKIGGGTIGSEFALRGIHGAHVGPGVNIRYAHSDRQRQSIPWVQVANNGQPVVEYSKKDVPAEDIKQMAVRTMDCIDCHNRPTHAFELPDRGLDRVLANGEASVALPYLKKKGLELLKANYASREEALRVIPQQIEAYYRDSHPQIYRDKTDDVRRSARAVASVYERNVFPEMKVLWGTYINNIGHTDFTGCFRCHDDEHASAGGKTITQDCSTCHEMLANDEQSPKILSDLGLK
jgi:hypothetical protein